VTSVEHALALVEPWLAAYGAIALFVAIYFESFGAPLPSESAMLAASVLAARGDLSIITVIAAAWSAAVLGDSTGYLIGRLGGRPLLMRFGPRIGLTAERFERVAGLVHRYGFIAVMLARFVFGLRQLNGLVAGALSMPPTRRGALGRRLGVGTFPLRELVRAHFPALRSLWSLPATMCAARMTRLPVVWAVNNPPSPTKLMTSMLPATGLSTRAAGSCQLSHQWKKPARLCPGIIMHNQMRAVVHAMTRCNESLDASEVDAQSNARRQGDQHA
jgi:membrane protein YqaA with SNARE-associated domain